MLSANPSPRMARLSLVLAAVLWSSGSVFVRVLRDPTGLDLESPRLTPLQIAVFRGLFAGLVLIPLLRRRDLKFQPAMLAMMLCFTTMSGLYLSALALGSAANAIFLQNTAPVWVCILTVYLLGERAGRRTWESVLLGLLGALVLVSGNWPWGATPEQYAVETEILLMGVGSGFMYACVVLFLGKLRNQSSAWLTVLNLLGSAVGLSLFVVYHEGWAGSLAWFSTPTLRQLGFLAVFGAVQMALPYWLFARGVRAIGTQEAGIITLLEPVLNPVWAYLISPETEVPTQWTIVGGGLLLLALGWRYVPESPRPTSTPPEQPSS